MPEVVGGAVYQLDLDKGTFSAGTKEAEQQFNRVRVAGDAVTKSSSGAGNALGGVGRTAVAVALGMGGLNIAVTGANTALRGTVQAAADDAASQARLEAAVKASGATYAQYEKQLDAVIAKGQQRGFSDDQTRGALSILIAQTDSITEATKRYAIAQDLARGANIDIVTASRLLGKITDENVTALQRYGISVKKGSSETEALAAVQKKFAGQAEAYANSTAGQFARTSDAISEAGESIGRVLLPGVAAAAEATAAGAADVEDFAGKLETAGHVGAGLFPSLVTGAIAFGAALGAVKIGELISGMKEAIALRGQLTKTVVTSPFATTPNVQVAQQVAGGFSLGTLGKSLLTPQVGIVAATLAVVGLDAAVRHFTGSGIVGFLRGEASAAKEAAVAHEAQAAAIDKINALKAQGVTPETAQAETITTGIATFEDARAKYLATVAAERESLAKIEAMRPPTPAPTASGTPLPGQTPTPALPVGVARATGDLDGYNTALRTFANTIIGANPNLAQLTSLLKQFPELRGSPEFIKFLEDTNRLLGTTALAAVDWQEAIKKAKDEASSFDTALSDIKGLASHLDPDIEALKLEKDQLEQLKNKMGDAFGAGNQAHLDDVTRRLDLLTSRQEIVTESISLFGAMVQQQYGALAPQAIENVTSLLAAMPKEEQIKLAILLPDLFKIQSAFKAFIEALRAGATVDIAIRVAATQAFPSNKPRSLFDNPFPGESQESFRERQSVSPDAQKLIDDLQGKLDNLTTNSMAPLGAEAAKTGSQLSQDDADLIALSAAFQAFHEATGGTVEDFRVLLQLAQDRIDLDKRQADVQVALRVASAEASDGLYQAKLGLVEIAEAAVQSGHTLPQQIALVFASIKQNAQSLLDSVLNQPTREGAQFKLQLDKLELQKLELERGGAVANRPKVHGKDVRTAQDKALDNVDKQITSLQREIDIRQKTVDIMRDEAVLADQGLQTDRTMINAYVFLVAIIRNVSNALNNLVSPLEALAAPGAEQGALINREQIVRVGEKGKPEVILPLTKPGRMMQLLAQSGALQKILSHTSVREFASRLVSNRTHDKSLRDVMTSKELSIVQRAMTMVPGYEDGGIINAGPVSAPNVQQLLAPVRLPALPEFRVPVFKPPHVQAQATQSAEVHVPGENSTVINIYGATDAEAVKKQVLRALDDRDRVRSLAGATSSRHSYTPR